MTLSFREDSQDTRRREEKPHEPAPESRKDDCGSNVKIGKPGGIDSDDSHPNNHPEDGKVNKNPQSRVSATRAIVVRLLVLKSSIPTAERDS